MKSAPDRMRSVLLKIEELFLQIDGQTRHLPEPIEYPELLLFQLQILLRELEASESLELQKCAQLADHIVPGMQRRHFLNLLIPIERALGRQVKDADFLVTDQDLTLTGHARRPDPLPLYFVLENLRSSFNVGSIFRLADGLGAREILLAGYTPGPESAAVQKTSLGAQALMPSRHFDDGVQAIQELKEKKIQVVGLETAKTAVPLHEFRFRFPTAFVVGNERFGLDPKTLQACDALMVLPLRGIKNSLNVATALSGAGFEWIRQWNQTQGSGPNEA